MWRIASWTIWFNLLLLVVGLLCSSLGHEMQSLLVISALANLGLREKTQGKIDG